ncbi:MAG: tetratricopeptide repeat protein [Bryobacteraceae bacterium]
MRLLLIFTITSLLLGASPTLDQALKLYNRTEFQASLKLLQESPEKTAATFDLIGRNHYMLGDFKKASESYEKAVALEPGNSTYENWLGKAYGRRAETSSPLTAPGHASKTRQHFEKAVALDPRNLEAANDLFEYYLEAPGFLGGGLDKAAALAKRIAGRDPVEGHWAQARIAEKRKEFGQAEAQLRRAAELAPKQVGRVVDLAKFFAKRGRFQESDQKFSEADKLAPGSPKLLFERAATYIQSKRNVDQARELLKRYLAAPLGPDDPPRTEAEKLLKVAGS